MVGIILLAGLLFVADDFRAISWISASVQPALHAMESKQAISAPERSQLAQQTSTLEVVSDTPKRDWTRTISTDHRNSSNKLQKWRSVLDADDFEWTARQLAQSENPDHWYLSSLMEILCTGPTIPAPGSPPQGDDRSPPAVELWKAVRARCGILSERVFAVQPPGSVKRARDAGSLLAAAPWMWNQTADGVISPEAADALRRILADPDQASAWLAMNHTRLASTSGSISALQELDLEESAAAYFLAMCNLADGCGGVNLLSHALCVQSMEAMCGMDGVRASIAAWVPADRREAVRVAALAIERAVSERDLAAFGLSERPH